MVIAVTCVVSVLCLVLGYALGQDESLSSRVSNTLLNQDVAGLQQELADLESKLIDAELNARVQREASSELRVDLADMRKEASLLQEELTFYKSLMAPGSLTEGLHVTEFDVQPIDDDGQYAFELLLTQVALRRSYINGDVRLDVIGRFAADEADKEIDEAVLSLTEMSDLTTYPLKFRFRFFQDVAGILTLPEGFEPDRVLVTASQKGKDPLQVTFPWPAL